MAISDDIKLDVAQPTKRKRLRNLVGIEELWFHAQSEEATARRLRRTRVYSGTQLSAKTDDRHAHSPAKR